MSTLECIFPEGVLLNKGKKTARILLIRCRTSAEISVRRMFWIGMYLRFK